MNFIKKFIMKAYERELLNDLQTKKGEEQFLGKVRNAIGAEIYATKYTPKFKAEVALVIRTTYWTPGPVQVAPAALPAGLQSNYPLYLFGLTDYQANYSRVRTLITSPAWDINTLVVYRLGQNPIGFGAMNSPLHQYGDVILSMRQVGYTGAAPDDHTIEIGIHCNNVAYSTFINSLSSDLLTLNLIKYVVPAANLTQFNNPVNLFVQSLLGKLASDTIDPNMFITGQTMQTNISDIPIKLPIDKNLIIGTQVNFDCVNFSFLLSVMSMQPLTNRPK